MMTLDAGTKPTICGGPLGDTSYEFAQLHFHWGDDDCHGAENEINNKHYPMEMHVVFFKKQYVDFNSALLHQDGLAVLGCLYEAKIIFSLDLEIVVNDEFYILDWKKG